MEKKIRRNCRRQITYIWKINDYAEINAIFQFHLKSEYEKPTLRYINNCITLYAVEKKKTPLVNAKTSLSLFQPEKLREKQVSK